TYRIKPSSHCNSRDLSPALDRKSKLRRQQEQKGNRRKDYVLGRIEHIDKHIQPRDLLRRRQSFRVQRRAQRSKARSIERLPFESLQDCSEQPQIAARPFDVTYDLTKPISRAKVENSFNDERDTRP